MDAGRRTPAIGSRRLLHRRRLLNDCDPHGLCQPLANHFAQALAQSVNHSIPQVIREACAHRLRDLIRGQATAKCDLLDQSSAQRLAEAFAQDSLYTFLGNGLETLTQTLNQPVTQRTHDTLAQSFENCQASSGPTCTRSRSKHPILSAESRLRSVCRLSSTCHHALGDGRSYDFAQSVPRRRLDSVAHPLA